MKFFKKKRGDNGTLNEANEILSSINERFSKCILCGSKNIRVVIDEKELNSLSSQYTKRWRGEKVYKKIIYHCRACDKYFVRKEE